MRRDGTDRMECHRRGEEGRGEERRGEGRGGEDTVHSSVLSATVCIAL